MEKQTSMFYYYQFNLSYVHNHELMFGKVFYRTLFPKHRPISLDFLNVIFPYRCNIIEIDNWSSYDGKLFESVPDGTVGSIIFKPL